MLNFNVCLSAFVVSYSQLVFSDRIFSGLFVWLGLFFLYPWNALGSIVATVMAVVMHRFLPVYTDAQQEAGWSGFNAAIVGLFWGGALADGSFNIFILVLVVVVTVFLEAILVRLLALFQLPLLSSPAMISIILFSLLLASSGEWYWLSIVAQYWDGLDRYIGVGCLIVAMAIMNVAATGWALTFAAATFVALEIVGIDAYEHVGLWALNIPLGVFAALAIFFIAPIYKQVATGITVLTIIAIWAVWHISYLHDYIQPIMVPMIISLWITLYLVRKYQSSDYLSTHFWKLASDLRLASNKQLPVYLLHVTNKDARIPLQHLLARASTPHFFLHDIELWELGKRIKANNRCVLMQKLLLLIPRVFFKDIITLVYETSGQDTNVAKPIKINESPEVITCIHCGACKPWPEIDVWKYAPIACDLCTQPLVPGSLVSWFSPTHTKQKLEGLLDHPSIVLILSVKFDPLIKNLIATLDNMTDQKIYYLVNGSDVAEGEIDQDVIDTKLFRRIKNLNTYLRIMRVFRKNDSEITYPSI